MRRTRSTRSRRALRAPVLAPVAALAAAAALSGCGGSGGGGAAGHGQQPTATSPSRPALNTYAFVRDTSRWGPDSVPFDLAKRYGADTVLFASNDPNLAAAVAAARARRASYGIWVPAGDGPAQPSGYALYLGMLWRRYEPEIVVANIEARGKGEPGSPGWAWNQRAARALARVAPGINVGIAVLPDQTDFNYDAWRRNGATVFLPEAFGADPRVDRYDPAAVVETVVRQGIPRSMIEPLLAPGQRYNGPASLYTLDDLPPSLTP